MPWSFHLTIPLDDFVVLYNSASICEYALVTAKDGVVNGIAENSRTKTKNKLNILLDIQTPPKKYFFAFIDSSFQCHTNCKSNRKKHTK
jgi:hypothetical protein